MRDSSVYSLKSEYMYNRMTKVQQQWTNLHYERSILKICRKIVVSHAASLY